MTTVPFGNRERYAIVYYDKSTQTCLIVANSTQHLPDAFALVNSMKVDPEAVMIVAPKGSELYYQQLVAQQGDMVLYGYKK